MLQDKKINITPDESFEAEEKFEPSELVVPEKPKIKIPVVKAKEKYFDPAAYAKKYRAEHAAKITKQRKEHYDKDKFKILRDKMLWYLNHGAEETQ